MTHELPPPPPPARPEPGYGYQPCHGSDIPDNTPIIGSWYWYCGEEFACRGTVVAITPLKVAFKTGKMVLSISLSSWKLCAAQTKHSLLRFFTKR